MPTIALLGDVMLGRGVNDDLAHLAPADVWGSTLTVLEQADAVVANLECAITRHRRRWRRSHKVFHFRADPRAVDVLRAANVRCVSLANNHTLDYEVAGLLETLDVLDAAGIARVGAGRDDDEARAPAVLDVAGLRVGFVGATDNEPSFRAARDRPGTNFVDIERSPRAVEEVAGSVAAARAAGAELVVLALHWGPNMVAEPPDAFREFAGAVLEAGADVLYGHSAHVFQGVERIDGRLVLYDTGDFIDDYAVDPALRNDWSFVFLVDVASGGRLECLRLLPVRLDYARVSLAVGHEHHAICELMRQRSHSFGITFTETADGLELPLDALDGQTSSLRRRAR